MAAYRWSVLHRTPELTFESLIPCESIDLRPRHLALPTFAATIPYDGNLDGPVGQLLAPGAGLVFTLNGHIVMSGPITKTARHREAGKHSLEVGGVGDLQYVADRLANPEPATAVPPYDTDTHDVRTDIAETIVKAYVDVNLGGGAIVARQLAGLVIAGDLARGPSLTGRARFDNLLEFLFGLAESAGLGVSLVQTAQGELTFDVYEPEDKSTSVRFSDRLGNVKTYEYDIARPTATHVTVGGGGEGTARLFIEDDVASDWGRIEAWKDQRQTTDTGELTQAAADVLSEGSERFAVAAEVVATSAHQWAPLTDDPTVATFDVGDTVSVVVDGVAVPEVIREIQVTYQGGATTVVPIVGSTEPPDPSDRRYAELAAAYRTLRARLDLIERST
jgi:hypothetical protein